MNATSKKTASDKGSKGSQAVLRRLERACRDKPILPPLERLILAVLADGGDREAARQGLERLRNSYVDWNECRVARRAELARLLEPLPEADERAQLLRESLNRLFDVRGAMDLAFLGGVRPAEGRRYLLEIYPDLPRPQLALILFEVCPGVTLPLSAEALRLARKEGLIGRSGTKQQLQTRLQEEFTPVEAATLVQCLTALTAPEPKARRRSSTRADRKKKGGRKKPATRKKKAARNKITGRKTARNKTRKR